MASKRGIRRRLQNKACQGKHKHDSHGQAVAHVVQLQRSGLAGRNIRPYRCQFCGRWHVGHFSPG